MTTEPQLTIYLSESLNSTLRKFCDETGVTLSGIGARGIEMFLGSPAAEVVRLERKLRETTNEVNTLRLREKYRKP